MDKYQLLDKIRNNPHNTNFNDFVRCIKKFGFVFDRQKGTSHIMFKRDGVKENINIQELNGKAKTYQIKQFVKIVEKYKL